MGKRINPQSSGSSTPFEEVDWTRSAPPSRQDLGPTWGFKQADPLQQHPYFMSGYLHNRGILRTRKRKLGAGALAFVSVIGFINKDKVLDFIADNDTCVESSLSVQGKHIELCVGENAVAKTAAGDIVARVTVDAGGDNSAAIETLLTNPGKIPAELKGVSISDSAFVLEKMLAAGSPDGVKLCQEDLRRVSNNIKDNASSYANYEEGIETSVREEDIGAAKSIVLFSLPTLSGSSEPRAMVIEC